MSQQDGTARGPEDMNDHVRALKEFLGALPPGPVGEVDVLWEHLAWAYDGLKFDGATWCYTLMLNTLEFPEWHSPTLTFLGQQRQGDDPFFGSAHWPKGATQEWSLNADTMTISMDRLSAPRFRASAPRFNAKRAVAEVVALVLAQADHPTLEWNEDRDEVEVLVWDLVPGGLSRTVENRVARFRDLLEEAMEPLGWETIGTRDRYWRVQPVIVTGSLSSVHLL